MFVTAIGIVCAGILADERCQVCFAAREGAGEHVSRRRSARRTSNAGVEPRLRAAGDIRTRRHGQKYKSQDGALPCGPTPPARRTVSAEGATARGRGSPTLSTPTPGGAMLRCGHCDYACLQQDHLDKHVKRRHGHIGRNGRHVCEWCEYSTEHPGNLRRHHLTHTGERRHRCDDCGKAFALLCTLTFHRRLHSGEKPYSCDVCGKAFAQFYHLSRHKRIHSGRNSIHKCEWCEYSTDQPGNLRRHHLTHTGERRHRCDDCGKAFALLSTLTVHRRLHSGEKPYSCDVCGKAFAQVCHLTRHKRIHSGEKVRRCDQCGASFNDVSHYNRHSMYHIGVKPYRCQECSARFVTRSQLTYHMRTHTRDHDRTVALSVRPGPPSSRT